MLWFNVTCAALAAAEARYAVLQPLLPVNVFAALSFVLPVGNALLRAVTVAPLSVGNGNE